LQRPSGGGWTPPANAELVNRLAEDTDAEADLIGREREAGETQEAFETWLEDRFGAQAVQEHVAGLDDEHEHHDFADAIVDLFEQETGLDTSSLDVEPDAQALPTRSSGTGDWSS
jgi:hypothetical protein